MSYSNTDETYRVSDAAAAAAAAAFLPLSFLARVGLGSFWVAARADTRARTACTNKQVNINVHCNKHKQKIKIKEDVIQRR